MQPSTDTTTVPTSTSVEATETQSQMSRSLVLLMAVACGLAVANLYYNQPLLVKIAGSLKVTERQVGILPTLGKMGYATGLLFIAPLGDILARRRLIVTLFGLVSLCLLVAAFAPSLGVLAPATYAIGVFTVMAQVMLPFAMRLAAPHERGQVVGSIMSGLLIGILLSRTISGYVGELWGWRATYGLAAIAMIATGVTLRFQLPEGRATSRMPYPQLLLSILGLIKEQPTLRAAAVTGSLVFGAFSAFWTALAFLVEGPAYGYGAHIVGLFGLVGAAGALAAPMVGKVGDKRNPALLVGVGIVLLLVSYLILWLFGLHLWGLILGVILLDLGTQAAHVSNQTRVFGLLPDAQSRLNTVYMVSYFLGGATGSYLGALGWSLYGWNGVCAAGGGMAFLAIVLHCLTRPTKAPNRA